MKCKWCGDDLNRKVKVKTHRGMVTRKNLGYAKVTEKTNTKLCIKCGKKKSKNKRKKRIGGYMFVGQ